MRTKWLKKKLKENLRGKEDFQQWKVLQAVWAHPLRIRDASTRFEKKEIGPDPNTPATTQSAGGDRP